MDGLGLYYEVLLLTPIFEARNFIKPIFSQRNLIITLAKRQFASHYAGSFLGFLWTFIQPTAMLIVLWLIFGLGFRLQPKSDVPFIVWLASGIAVWSLFTNIINSVSGIIVAHTYLIKNHRLHSQILPVITIISCLFSHILFVLVLIILIFLQHLPFSLYFMQFFYYLLCMVVLVLGLGWAISALQVFIRDVIHLVRIVTQLGFWLTPIFWDIDIVPPNFHFLVKLNPMYYIVQGYRDSFIYAIPFWEHPYQTAYFWVFSVICLAAGATVFSKLKPQFVDVL